MADPDSRYPCSSIEDDFNYGSSVASASVHIRMVLQRDCTFSKQYMGIPSAPSPTLNIIRLFHLWQSRRSRMVNIFYKRPTFLRKVYSILSLQVLLTTVTSTVFLYFESIRTFVHESPALILLFALGSLGLIFALTLNRHKYPLNLYLLFGFTLLEALTVAVVVTFYDVYIILQAFILTTTVFFGLTVYTLQSKRDFSKFGAGLFALLWILCLSGFLKLFFYSETMELVLAAAGALLFCGFIIYDTHSLMHKLSPEEYVLAAISLYLDIINLFLHLLRFLEAVNKK
ncbi:PREDICTED: protein lifeguard 4 isoform X3 [Cercocebus atys]|uniref:Transmembrane BAX inhibitor motif containing 4 n=1 Tax=Cercocebus atys TaxID=9531 RepID=A0A2K5P697_CERAT|nr:PREDICTED: protein lifeguard 4 isoform X3 [Cercocebus atys]